MNVKIEDLAGQALDFTIANCEDKLPEIFDDWSHKWASYSTCWGSAGPILEREKITVAFDPEAKEWVAVMDADMRNAEGFSGDYYTAGPTYLVAGLRCYAKAKFGNTVKVPDEVCEAIPFQVKSSKP